VNSAIGFYKMREIFLLSQRPSASQQELLHIINGKEFINIIVEKKL
jgi:hypothetical protein